MVTGGGAAAEGDLAVVLVNAPPAEAPGLARALVERRLAACVNVVPKVTSFYVWDGALQEEEESTLLIKTTAAQIPALTLAVRELHSYSVPEVIALPVLAAGNPEYLAWVRSCVAAS